MGRSESKRGKRIAALLLLAAVTPVQAGAQAGGPQLVGGLPAQPPTDPSHPDRANGHLVVNPVTRRLYQIRDTNGVVEPTKLDAFDLDTLRPLGRTSLGLLSFPTAAPLVLKTTDGEGFAGIPFAVDEQGGRLFFPYYRQTAGFTAGIYGVVIFDEKTRRVTNQEAPRTFPVSGLAEPLGAYWSPHESRLYILGRTVLQKNPDLEQRAVQEGGVAGLPTTVVLRWNPDRPASQVQSDPLGYAEAVRPVRACRRALPSELTNGKFQSTVLSSAFEPSVWVACSTANLGFQLIRLDRNQLADPSGLEEVYPGPERVRSTLADPATDRILARYASGGETWWVFDGRRRAWVGRIGVPTLPQDLAAGLDPGTGRLYLYYSGVGLLRADARRQEVPQADVFGDIKSTGWGLPIVFDPPTRRFFLRAAPDRYDVYRDDPPVAEPPPDDPDVRTTDVEEEEGRTGAGFAGVARSYGARVLLIGGGLGLAPPDQFGTTRGVLLDLGSPCGSRERELAIGLVEEANLGASEASARAHALKTDDATRQDLGSPSGCDLNPGGDSLRPLEGRYPGLRSLPDPSPPPGERNSNLTKFLDREAGRRIAPDSLLVAAECSGDQGTRYNAPRQPFQGDPFNAAPAPLGQALAGAKAHRIEAEVRCEQSNVQAAGKAGGPALEIAPSAPAPPTPAPALPAVRVARAHSETSLFRDARRGVVAQAHALAQGIAIGETRTGPVVSIDAIESWAESSANGRRKSATRADTAAARFVRRVTGVTVRNPDGEVVFTCQDCSRDLVAAQQNINQALGGRAEVRLPMPDPRLITGTPGGYQAAVQKDELQIRADTALNNDPSFQLPGLEIVAISDDPSLRARQVVQLAGVATATSYGIFQITDFSLPAGDFGEPLPLGTEVLSTATEGTTVFESDLSGPPPSLGPTAESGSLPARVLRGLGRSATLLVRNPREGLLAAGVWLALAAPIFAFTRRRILVRSLSRAR